MKSNFNIEYQNIEEEYKILITRIRDFFNKVGFKNAVLGLSGGLDSTVCAVLLADALGAANVIGISLPSILTPVSSNSDAKQLAENLGINYHVVPIIDVVNTFNNQLNTVFDEISEYDNCFQRGKSSFTQDNIQARTRATILYAISNEFDSTLPIATSDKSEIYMGYGTINGDLSGALLPLADVTKTKLFALGYWLNNNRNKKDAIPLSILKKRPSAELAINPKTNMLLCAEDALMPYEFIDEIIYLIEKYNYAKDDIEKIELNYVKKYNISQQQKAEWIEKFYHRMKTQHFKLTLLPPAIAIEKNSYLTKCNKIYSEIA